MAERELKLHGRVFIRGVISAATGLHIGGSEGALAIGGVDNTVVRDLLTGRPYIPGSSLKGKMRSLTEKNDGKPFNKRIGQAWIHSAETEADYNDSDVSQIYGVAADDWSLPTRLVVRDVPLTDASAQQLAKLNTDLPFTEVKWEVAIDRITSAAVPRQMERVPAGAKFGEFEIVFNLFQAGDERLFTRVIDGMSLLEDDYLGGSGSRGSGKIAFENIFVTLKKSSDYTNKIPLANAPNLDALIAALEMITPQIAAVIADD